MMTAGIDTCFAEHDNVQCHMLHRGRSVKASRTMTTLSEISEASQSVQKMLDCLQSSVGETAGKPVSCVSVHCSNAILATIETQEAAETEGAGKELQTESLSERIAAQAVLRNLPSMSGYQRDQLFHLITADDFLWLVRAAAITLAPVHAKEALGEHWNARQKDELDAVRGAKIVLARHTTLRKLLCHRPRRKRFDKHAGGDQDTDSCFQPPTPCSPAALPHSLQTHSANVQLATLDLSECCAIDAGSASTHEKQGSDARQGSAELMKETGARRLKMDRSAPELPRLTKRDMQSTSCQERCLVISAIKQDAHEHDAGTQVDAEVDDLLPTGVSGTSFSAPHLPKPPTTAVKTADFNSPSFPSRDPLKHSEQRQPVAGAGFEYEHAILTQEVHLHRQTPAHSGPGAGAPSHTPGTARERVGHAGVGLGFERGSDGNYTIFALQDGGPAATSGEILIGDQLLAVDGVPIRGLSVQQVICLIRGTEDSAICITVGRPALETLEPHAPQDKQSQDSSVSSASIRSESLGLLDRLDQDVDTDDLVSALSCVEELHGALARMHHSERTTLRFDNAAEVNRTNADGSDSGRDHKIETKKAMKEVLTGGDENLTNTSDEAEMRLKGLISQMRPLSSAFPTPARSTLRPTTQVVIAEGSGVATPRNQVQPGVITPQDAQDAAGDEAPPPTYESILDSPARQSIALLGGLGKVLPSMPSSCPGPALAQPEDSAVTSGLATESQPHPSSQSRAPAVLAPPTYSDLMSQIGFSP